MLVDFRHALRPPPTLPAPLQGLLEQGRDAGCWYCPCTRTTAAPPRARPSTRWPRTSPSRRWLPETRFVSQYHDHPAYIRGRSRTVFSAATASTARQRRQAAVLLSRGAPALPGPGRPLPLPVPQDHPPGSRSTWGCPSPTTSPRSSPASARRSGCSPTPTRRSRRLPGQGVKTVQVVCPGFRRGLPRDTSRRSATRTAATSWQPAATRVRLHPLPEQCTCPYIGSFRYSGTAVGGVAG